MEKKLFVASLVSLWILMMGPSVMLSAEKNRKNNGQVKSLGLHMLLSHLLPCFQ